MKTPLGIKSRNFSSPYIDEKKIEGWDVYTWMEGFIINIFSIQNKGSIVI